MSRRIETRSEMTDKDLACAAMDALEIQFDVRGDRIHMKSGDFRGMYLNLKTGDLVGDEDYHGEAQFGLLRQHYSEAQVRSEFMKSGVYIDERSVNKDGDIVLTWHMA